MKKTILLILFLTLSPLAGIGQCNILTIWQTGKPAVEFAFENKPRITYQAETMLVKANNIQVEYPLKEIEKITFNGAQQDAINSLYVKAKSGGISVYSMDGKLIQTIDQERQLNLDALPKGVYVIERNGVTFKLLKK